MSTGKVVPVTLTGFEFVEPRTKTISVRSDLTGEEASRKEQTPFSATVKFELKDAEKARKFFKDIPAFSDEKQEGAITYFLTTPSGNILISSRYYTPTWKEFNQYAGREYVPEQRGWSDELVPAHYEEKYEWVTKEVPEEHSQSLKVGNAEQFYELMTLLSKLAKSDSRFAESNRSEIKTLRKILLEAGKEFKEGAVSIAKERLASLSSKTKQRLEAIEQKREKLSAKI